MTTTAPLPPADLARLDDGEIAVLDAWWRSTMDLTVAQICLSDTALLREPLRPEHWTPFDMNVRNRVSRYHLVIDALHDEASQPPGAQALEDWCTAELAEHHAYVREHMEDRPEVRHWRVVRAGSVER